MTIWTWVLKVLATYSRSSRSMVIPRGLTSVVSDGGPKSGWPNTVLAAAPLEKSPPFGLRKYNTRLREVSDTSTLPSLAKAMPTGTAMVEELASVILVKNPAWPRTKLGVWLDKGDWAKGAA